jgi:OmpA-OmpF porin, OOP family
MRSRNLLLFAASLLALPMAATAQPVAGIYVSLGAGYNYMTQWSEQSLTVPSGAFAASENGKGGGGPGVVGSFGYGFGNGVRVELEGSWRQSSHDFTNSASSSTLQSYGGMVNALYDFDVGAGWVYPYIGAGIGYQQTHIDNITFHPTGTTTETFGGGQGGFAAQAMLGAGFPIHSVPGLSVTVEYRFMGVFTDENFTGSVSPPPANVTFRMGHQYNHAGLIGLRYAFGIAPPPPPAPMPASTPAPAPARTYLVFFDWDKANLTDRARQIIADAAQASTHVNTTQIEVDGNADLSGTPQYNQGLSLRRAQAVGAELVKDGVSQNLIFIQAFGDTRPLVPTARGVREPQNRRVEIILK